ncbi:gallinacin-12-like [Cygnus olor]|uniref:gallinacin-12-like n=1 Tax=Cygnus olor TaxID=8869 RepID=UPI001ADE86E3|nr:gallinacin-12-like [Cygnus olor]XP_040406595.1 gallinacin-12-like [Cygnus olor]
MPAARQGKRGSRPSASTKQGNIVWSRSTGMPSRLPTARRDFCKIPRSALLLSSRTQAMGTLGLVLIFISLIAHGHAHGPDSCNHEGGLCRVGNCIPGEYLAKYCFEPIILCCKSLPLTTVKS